MMKSLIQQKNKSRSYALRKALNYRFMEKDDTAFV